MLLFACIAALLVGLVIGAVLVEYMIPNIGTINEPALQYYVDDEYMVTPIDWGACDPGAEYYANFTVVNSGMTELTVYIVTYGLPSNWDLTWGQLLYDANMTTLQPTEKVMGWLNVTIPMAATSWPDWGFYLRGE